LHTGFEKVQVEKMVSGVKCAFPRDVCKGAPICPFAHPPELMAKRAKRAQQVADKKSRGESSMGRPRFAWSDLVKIGEAVGKVVINGQYFSGVTVGENGLNFPNHRAFDALSQIDKEGVYNMRAAGNIDIYLVNPKNDRYVKFRLCNSSDRIDVELFDKNRLKDPDAYCARIPLSAELQNFVSSNIQQPKFSYPRAGMKVTLLSRTHKVPNLELDKPSEDWLTPTDAVVFYKDGEWRYRCETMAGDCGYPVISENLNVVGFHSVGGPYNQSNGFHAAKPNPNVNAPGVAESISKN
jgi:hypothetical protein